jgi:hypothetical protein
VPALLLLLRRCLALLLRQSLALLLHRLDTLPRRCLVGDALHAVGDGMPPLLAVEALPAELPSTVATTALLAATATIPTSSTASPTAPAAATPATTTVVVVERRYAHSRTCKGEVAGTHVLGLGVSPCSRCTSGTACSLFATSDTPWRFTGVRWKRVSPEWSRTMHVRGSMSSCARPRSPS